LDHDVKPRPTRGAAARNCADNRRSRHLDLPDATSESARDAPRRLLAFFSLYVTEGIPLGFAAIAAGG
jgi:hypothetical protein